MADIIVKDIKNGSEYYYGWSAGVSAEDVSYDNTESGMTADNVQDAIDEVFQSVSNGKTLIAAAITDKGVSTAATDSFQTMASNIGLIETVSDYDAFITKQYTKTNFYQDGWNNNIIYVYPTWDFFNQDKSKYYRYFMVFDTAQRWFWYYHLWIATKTENDDFVINVLWDTWTLASDFILYNNRKKIVWNDVYYSTFFSCRDIYQTPQITTYYYINCTNSTLWNLVTIGNSNWWWTEETAYVEWDTNCWISEAENINDVNKTTLSVQDVWSNYWDLIINLI